VVERGALAISYHEQIDAQAAWRRICRAVRQQINPALFRICFSGTRGIDLREGTLTVAAPTATVREQLSRRFAQLVALLAEQTLHEPIAVRFTTAPALAAPPQGAAPREILPVAVPVAVTPPDLNPNYTFDRFIVGDSNRLAYAAAHNVAAAPGQTYNPLFIYGGVGLGKTHLLMAIGHAAVGQDLRVVYVTAETFTNEIVEAIQHNHQAQFRARYRAMDVLLVDDIQFIGGKDRTEEEFFHTFNTLHNAGRQIVVTSDRPPRDIPTLHDRLRSRFEWGLMADVGLPSYEHRLAIVRAKAAELRVAMPQATLEYIARPDGVSVRQIEGAINRVAAAARVQGGKITLPLAAAALHEIYGERERLDLSPRLVVDVVAEHYHLSPEEILGKSRHHSIAWPRQVAMFLLREETDNSLAQIGASLGGRDHTTIMHGCDQVAEALRHDEHLQREIDGLRAALHAL
jgi:chromosomal replication initiator protein